MPPESLTRQILAAHLEDGELVPGSAIGLRVDQTLLQDATGTMAFMQYEQLGVDRIQVERAVQYVDHNVVALDHKNPDDHRFLRALAARHGGHFSRPGNGISHYIHLERFGRPGDILVAADSHSTTGGALGMLSIGAGGLDVAVVMGGHAFELACPEVVEVCLEGELARPWVQAKDVILELLRRLSVRGGKGRVFAFTGPGVREYGDAPELLAAPAPEPYVDDVHILPPPSEDERERIEIPRGPNIKPPPEHTPPGESIEGRIATVQDDDVSTGDLAPDGVEVMAYRSNVPAIAEFTLRTRDPEFRERIREWGGGFIVGGENYGQGSSREHAALAPLQLGVRAVIAKSFARIHRRNLVAQGIVALTFDDPSDHGRAEVGQTWSLPHLRQELERGSDTITARIDGDREVKLRHDFTDKEREVLLCGGLLAYLSGRGTD
jgi:aconitase A